MKITIETSNKTIKVEEALNVGELVKQLREVLGDKMNEYTLMPYDIKWVSSPAAANPVVLNPVWVNPTWIYPSYPSVPYDPWRITCGGTTAPETGYFNSNGYNS